MSANSATVKSYILKHEKWRLQLDLLRKLCLAAGFDEEIKWGAPAYTIKNRNVIGLVAFKNHIALWFHQGVFLTDPNNVLINANKEGKTKGLLQWRFTENCTITEKLVTQYLAEAKTNELDGKRIVPVKTKQLQLPEQLETALKNDSELSSAFSKLNFSKQKEYVNHILDAKRDVTKISRLEKAIPLILKGIGLNDKYRK